MATPIAEVRSDDQIRQQFPAFSWLLAIPEIHAILADENISTTDQFNAKLMSTNWFKTTEPSIRAYTQLAAEDPKALAQQQGQKQSDVNDMYKSLGLAPNDADVQAIADQALRMHWTDSQLNDAVVSHVRTSGLDLNAAGSMQSSVAALKQLASNYYVGLDDGTATQWATQIAAGEKKITDFAPVVQSWAKNKFASSPEVQNALAQGVTVHDYFAPYRTEAAKLMETTADGVDFQNSPLYSKILNYSDPKTGVQRPMSFSEMDTYLRGTDEYDHTKGALDAAASMGAGILKTFGKVA